MRGVANANVNVDADANARTSKTIYQSASFSPRCALVFFPRSSVMDWNYASLSPRKSSAWLTAWPWMLSTAVFVLLSLHLLLIRQTYLRPLSGDFTNGFPTELGKHPFISAGPFSLLTVHP